MLDKHIWSDVTNMEYAIMYPVYNGNSKGYRGRWDRKLTSGIRHN